MVTKVALVSSGYSNIYPVVVPASKYTKSCGIIIAAAVVGIVGIVIGVLLGIASEKFKVEVDEKEILVRAELPGNNCGGCGYAGCDALAKAIAEGKAKVDQCPVGGAPVGEKIAAIMGVEAGSAEKKVAFDVKVPAIRQP